MPRDKEALAQFHRSAMLEAAQVLFTQKGVAATTMDDIAKAAGYSKATLYVYFKNKEEMVGALALKGMVGLRDRLAAAAKAPGDFFARYTAIYQALAAYYREEPLAFLSTLSPINIDLEAPGTPAVYRQTYQVGEELNALLTALLEDGMAEGTLREGLPLPETVFLLWGSLSGLTRMAKEKEAYLRAAMGLSPTAFLEHGARLLLRSITKEGQDHA